ncbi:hypothetical protein ACAW74_18110 [Fibrella sp. WM1]|uniref:hypothetical protein n=1 Tax=Fibrella musci TaxID=3242485 RepID=UPI00352172A7
MTPTIDITQPYEHLVFQRDNANRAAVPIVGKAPVGTDTIEVVLTPLKGKTATIANQRIKPDAVTGKFSGTIIALGGTYELTLTAKKNGLTVATGSVGRVNVGEVFIIYGHSVAQGGQHSDVATYGNTAGPGANDDRVIVDAGPAPDPFAESALGKPGNFKPLTVGSNILPFHGAPYAYGYLGDLLVKQLDVPVLFLGCAFGGSNLDGAVKVIQGIPFEHPFVKYDQRMPIRPVEAALSVYGPLTGGFRGVLMNHGANDKGYGITTDAFLERMRVVINYIRQKAQRADLTFWVAVDSDSNPEFVPIIAGQEKAIATLPNLRRGADLKKLLPTDRPDNVHLNQAGLPHYAQAWADVLTPADLAAVPMPAVVGENNTGLANLATTVVDGLDRYLPAALLVVAVVLLGLTAWSRRRPLVLVSAGLAGVAGTLVIWRSIKPTSTT